MKKFKEPLPKKLVWESNSKATEYYLSFENDKLAKLSWANKAGTLATGKMKYGEWSFKRTGFFRPYITIRRSNEKQNIGVVKFNFTNNSVLKFSTGETFYWRNLNAWRGEWGFLDNDKNLVLRVVPNFNKKGADGFVYIESLEEVNETAAILLLVSWYIVISYFTEEENEIKLMD